MSYLTERQEWIHTPDCDKELYQRFVNKLWDKHKKKLEDIKNWTFAGYFAYGVTKATIDQWTDERLASHGSKVMLGLRIWKRVMGEEFEMPVDQGEPKCVCDVDIQWNYIIVDDPKAEEPEMLILGSECIKGFFNIDTDSKCSLCGDKINNSVSGKCKKCRNRRFCPKKECGKELPKYRRGDYCSDKCENPEQFCPTEGCGNKRKVWQRKMMPTCYTCYKKKPCKR